jgi:hypothetical protein
LLSAYIRWTAAAVSGWVAAIVTQTGEILMKRPIRLLSRSVFAVAILGSLGFGAAEALAMSRPQADAARPWCEPVKCNADCGGYGVCSGFNCYCY